MTMTSHCRLPLVAILGLTFSSGLCAQETPPLPATEVVEPMADLTAEDKYQRARSLALGQGVPKNMDEAFRLMKEASGEGHPEATGAIGLFHQNGWAGLMPNDKEAVAWYKKGHELGGLRASYNYGVMLVNGLGVDADLDKGLPLIERAAEARIPEAQLVYGSYFYYGKFGKPKDFSAAFNLFKSAAEAGNAHAANMLGIMLEHGKGVSVNHEEAIKWYRDAATQNIIKAQANLAILLGPDGKEPERRREALKWLHIAADNNEITAVKMLQAIQPAIRAEEASEAKRQSLRFRIQMVRAGLSPQ